MIFLAELNGTGNGRSALDSRNLLLNNASGLTVRPPVELRVGWIMTGGSDVREEN